MRALGAVLRPYLWEQLGDNLQGGLVDGVVLQWGRQGHVHQRPDLLQHHLPAARVTQHLLVLVNLLLQDTGKGHTDTTINPLDRDGLPIAQVDCVVFPVLPFLVAEKLYLKHLDGKNPFRLKPISSVEAMKNHDSFHFKMSFLTPEHLSFHHHLSQTPSSG